MTPLGSSERTRPRSQPSIGTGSYSLATSRRAPPFTMRRARVMGAHAVSGLGLLGVPAFAARLRVRRVVERNTSAARARSDEPALHGATLPIRRGHACPCRRSRARRRRRARAAEEARARHLGLGQDARARSELRTSRTAIALRAR